MLPGPFGRTAAMLVRVSTRQAVLGHKHPRCVACTNPTAHWAQFTSALTSFRNTSHNYRYCGPRVLIMGKYAWQLHPPKKKLTSRRCLEFEPSSLWLILDEPIQGPSCDRKQHCATLVSEASPALPLLVVSVQVPAASSF